MHLSTRILVLLLAAALIAGGWWLLLAYNNLVMATIYGAVWTALVLIVTRILLAIGFGYNRYSARRSEHAATGRAAQSALGELDRLRDSGLISPEEYATKRAGVIQRI